MSAQGMMLREPEIEGEKSFEQEIKFYEQFLKEDMKKIDEELFPHDELHTGELNPIVGRRLFAQKMN